MPSLVLPDFPGLANVGESEKTEAFLNEIYSELKTIAHRLLKNERANHTLRTTALMNEAVIKLFYQSRIKTENRNHFLALAARVMRHTLADYARKRNALKRGGELVFLELADDDALTETPLDVITLHELLEMMEKVAPRQHHLIELRYFGGFSLKEIVEITGLSDATIRLDLKKAKTWLRHKLQQG